MAGIRYCQNVS